MVTLQIACSSSPSPARAFCATSWSPPPPGSDPRLFHYPKLQPHTPCSPGTNSTVPQDPHPRAPPPPFRSPWPSWPCSIHQVGGPRAATQLVLTCPQMPGGGVCPTLILMTRDTGTHCQVSCGGGGVKCPTLVTRDTSPGTETELREMHSLLIAFLQVRVRPRGDWPEPPPLPPARCPL